MCLHVYLRYRKRKCAGVLDLKQKQVRSYLFLSAKWNYKPFMLCFDINVYFEQYCMWMRSHCVKKILLQVTKVYRNRKLFAHFGDLALFWKVFLSFSRLNNLLALTETTLMMVCMPESHPGEPEQIWPQEKLNPQILRRSATQPSNTPGTMKTTMKIWEWTILILMWGEKQNSFETQLLI